MSKLVFINLPTENVAAAREFYEKMGFDINTEYSTNENVFVILSKNVQLILADKAFLRQLGETREFADASKVTEVSVALEADNREEVDKLFDAAIAAGGKQAGETQEDEEFGLYSRGFYDLDSHKIDVHCMTT